MLLNRQFGILDFNCHFGYMFVKMRPLIWRLDFYQILFDTIFTVNQWSTLHSLVLYCHSLLFTHINYIIKAMTFLPIIVFSV